MALPDWRVSAALSVMRCAECESVADDTARGWTGFRADDPELNEPPQLAFFCPACTTAEFGDRFANRNANPS